MIIGICGKPGNGKDTIGNLLVNQYGFSRLTIKHPIETAVKVIFSVDDYHLYDRDGREQELPEWPGWTVRKLLQGTAQALRDMVGEHLWATSLVMRSNYDPAASRIVVTDVRTPGDVNTIRKHVEASGGKFVLFGVQRPGWGATTAGGFENHKLESYDLFPECDAVFQNDTTIADLHARVCQWMSERGMINKATVQPQG